MTKCGIEWSAGVVLSTLLATSAFAQTPPAKRGPANLCVELVAYLHKDQKKPEAAPAAAGSASTTAVQAPPPGGDRPTAGGSDNPQQTSGLSAPVTHGGTGASGPQGQAQETAPTAKENPKVEGKTEATATNKLPEPAKPATPAPAAAQAPVAPPPKPEVVQEAEAAASAGDQLACRAAAQKMRRAGVALPLTLIALAALDPKFLPPKAAEQGGAPEAPGGAGTEGANP